VTALKLERIIARVYGEWTPACREAAREIVAELAALPATAKEKPKKARAAK
jgi:hypothetical protein